VDAPEELEPLEDGAEEPLELQYAIHVCAGPAYIMDPEYDDFQLAKQCASEYIGQDLGYLVGDGPDRHYKPYPVDSIYIPGPDRIGRSCLVLVCPAKAQDGALKVPPKEKAPIMGPFLFLEGHQPFGFLMATWSGKQSFCDAS